MTKCNRNYVAHMMEYYELFPTCGRMRKNNLLDYKYAYTNDFYPGVDPHWYKKYSKCWKDQRKVRKQWEK